MAVQNRRRPFYRRFYRGGPMTGGYGYSPQGYYGPPGGSYRSRGRGGRRGRGRGRGTYRKRVMGLPNINFILTHYQMTEF